MTDKINVISINPAKDTPGAMHPELSGRKSARRVILDTNVSLPSIRPAVNFIFGINRNVTTAWSIKLLLTRMIAGGTLLATGIINYNGAVGYDVPTMLITLGIILIFGIFSRILSGIGAMIFASVMITAYWGISTSFLPYTVMVPGQIRYAYLFCCVMLVLCAIIGPGRFSVDQIIRMIILKLRKKAIKRKRALESKRRMSYQAYQYS